LQHDPRVEARTRIGYGQATVGGVSTEVLAYEQSGTAPPAVVRGRLPVGSGEIALGAKLLRRLHAHIGSEVSFSVAEGELEAERAPRDLRLSVVGVTVLPLFGESELADGAVVTLDAVHAANGNATPRIVLVRLDRNDRLGALAALDRDYTEEIHGDAIPARVVNLHGVRGLPLSGAAITGILAVLLLFFTLTASARTKDLGVLRALGMTSRRVGRVVSAEGALFAGVIVAIGIPLGLIIGAFGWRAIADAFGVENSPSFPFAIVLVIPATFVVAFLAARLPARRARRSDVARMLHSE
jgi:putative ABC transport system permease protein